MIVLLFSGQIAFRMFLVKNYQRGKRLLLEKLFQIIKKRVFQFLS